MSSLRQQVEQPRNGNTKLAKMAVIFFENQHEFTAYVEKHKPKEIWCAWFSDDDPIIIVDEYFKKSANINYRGKFNKQGVGLSGKYTDFLKFWKESFYIKLIV